MSSRSPRRRLLVFARAPVPGRVKTRLVPALGAAAAAELYAALLEDLLDRLATGDFEVTVVWEGEVPAAYRDVAPGHGRQTEGDLGRRMHAALTTVAAGGAVALVGSDLPTLGAGRVAEAFDRLEEGADVVVGPAWDGGYYLIAGRPETLPAELFEGVPWGSPEVCEATLRRCRSAGLSVSVLAVERDVDTPEDLAWLEAAVDARTVAPGRVTAWLASRRLGTGA